MRLHGTRAAVRRDVAQEPQKRPVEPRNPDPAHSEVTGPLWVAQQLDRDKTTYHDTEAEADAMGAACTWRMK